MFRKSGVPKAYGCERVRGVSGLDGGRGEADYLAYDPGADEFVCYGIASSAKRAKATVKRPWCGSYNVLVVAADVLAELGEAELLSGVPHEVGLSVCVDGGLISIREPERIRLSEEKLSELKAALMRALFLKSGRSGLC